MNATLADAGKVRETADQGDSRPRPRSGKPRPRLAVAVCDCSSGGGSAREQAPLVAGLRELLFDIPVREFAALCSEPERAGAWLDESACDRLVVVGCGGKTRQRFAAVLAERGRSPVDVEVVPLTGSSGAEEIRPYVVAAVRYLQTRGAARPELVAETELPQVRRVLSRRALFTRPAPASGHRLAPRIRHLRCAASRGCRLCVDSCPTGALRVVEQQLDVRLDACEGCSACVAACPRKAIDKPDCHATPLRARMKSLLHSAGEDSLSLLLLCPPAQMALEQLQRRGLTLPSRLRVMPLPCMRLLPASWLIDPLLEGARRVLVNACDPRCRWQPDDQPFRPALKVAASLVTAAGGTLRAVGELDVLAAPAGEIAAQAAALIDGACNDPTPDHSRLSAAVAAIHHHSWARPPESVHASLPFADVKVAAEDCTLCGACAVACPSDALTADHAKSLEKRLHFRYHQCLACGKCQEACPEDVISVVPGLDEPRLLTRDPVVLADDQVVYCKLCREPFTTLASLNKVRSVLQAAGDAQLALDQLNYCPDCKLKVLMPSSLGSRRP